MCSPLAAILCVVGLVLSAVSIFSRRNKIFFFIAKRILHLSHGAVGALLSANAHRWLIPVFTAGGMGIFAAENPDSFMDMLACGKEWIAALATPPEQ